MPGQVSAWPTTPVTAEGWAGGGWPNAPPDQGVCRKGQGEAPQPRGWVGGWVCGTREQEHRQVPPTRSTWASNSSTKEVLACFIVI